MYLFFDLHLRMFITSPYLDAVRTHFLWNNGRRLRHDHIRLVSTRTSRVRRMYAAVRFNITPWLRRRAKRPSRPANPPCCRNTARVRLADLIYHTLGLRRAPTTTGHKIPILWQHAPSALAPHTRNKTWQVPLWTWRPRAGGTSYHHLPPAPPPPYRFIYHLPVKTPCGNGRHHAPFTPADIVGMRNAALALAFSSLVSPFKRRRENSVGLAFTHMLWLLQPLYLRAHTTPAAHCRAPHCRAAPAPPVTCALSRPHTCLHTARADARIMRACRAAHGAHYLCAHARLHASASAAPSLASPTHTPLLSLHAPHCMQTPPAPHSRASVVVSSSLHL